MEKITMEKITMEKLTMEKITMTPDQKFVTLVSHLRFRFTDLCHMITGKKNNKCQR